ncbi:protein phosphatase Slingshot homolog 2 isoform X2 [Xenopus tropicalis]|uniref:protein-serine/threonine phosphatase n=1 Tax=Xenopus tropicalis TaxID=8364 RepID=A0A8J0R0X3_XENTR|nr:protein phosphatase Slingshot homolog 2 isoform X2 [Xenopus tropicalis]
MALVTVQRSPTPSTTSSPCVSNPQVEESDTEVFCCQYEDTELFNGTNEADSGEEECRSQPRSISESFLTVKGAALFLPRGNGSSTPRISHRRNKHAGDLQQHLQAMFTLLRPEDNIRLAVKLESTYQNRTRYMVVVSTNGRQDTEESIVLGMDFASNDSMCTMGLVLPLWSDTLIHLDGDGGFSVSTDNRVHIFKPVSVQAMWSALQSLHKACEIARINNYYPGSLFLTWVSYYESHINSDQCSINEWNAMQDVQSHRSDSPVLFTDVPTERERTERLIKSKLREIMMQKDLENITSKEIRTELEMQMVCNLREFKEFIDNEMIVILGQMDSPTEIFDHVFLGSEWNASNLEDLQNRGVRYILNVTREIDNFFPGLFEYHNIRVYDEEGTDLLAYWNDTFKFISKAKKHGSKCLVHCKMGVSRSASTVIAYAMKEYGWNLDRAFDYVKERRTVTKPNPSFMKQLEEYQGILLASKQRHNKLWRSHSDSDLSDHHEPVGKTGLEMSKKDITSSAEQLSDTHHSFSLGPHTENCNPDCPMDSTLYNETQARFEFTSCDFHTEQIEDILNLNTMNGCPSRCCSDDTILDNCRIVEKDLTQNPESFTVPGQLPDLTLEDMEKDALKPEVNCHHLHLEGLNSDFRDLQESPDQLSMTSQSEELNGDRIDFLSALEKFVELSQENRPRSCSTTRADEVSSVKNSALKASWPETPVYDSHVDNQRISSDGSTSQTSEDSSTDEEQPKEISEQIVQEPLPKSHSENAISVKEIITEIESFNQGAGQCQQKPDTQSSQSQTPKRNTIHDLPHDFALDQENNHRQEPSDRSALLQNDKLRDSKVATWDGNPVSQENCENSNEANDYQELSSQAHKWCAGSVRRATLELEERLRQEQEQQYSATLPTRKNSKNDSAVGDTAPKGKLEDTLLDSAHGDHEKDRKNQLKIAESTEPNSSEPCADSSSSQISEPQCLLSKPESPVSEIKLKETTNEHGELHSLESVERKIEPIQLPKRIEIIEYSIGIKSPNDNELSQCEDGATLGEVLIETKTSMILSPEMPFKEIPETETDNSLHADSLHLSETCELGSPSVSFSLTSQCEEHNSVNIPVPSACTGPSMQPDLLSTLYPYTQGSISLTGVTEECSSTDEDFSKPFSCTESYHTDAFEDFNEMMHRETDSALSQCSSEDLNLISTVSANILEIREVLDIPPLSFGFAHSSSTDSIKDLGSNPGVVKQKAKEIEARIRQAGLTTPSQMKRSASLAKLGCLELSKDDLSERESVSSDSQTYPDLLLSSLRVVPGSFEISPDIKSQDPPEKLCILSTQVESEPTKHFVEQIKTEECVVQSKPVEKPLVQFAKDFDSTQQGLSPSSESELTVSEGGSPMQSLVLGTSVPLVSISPKHEHGRTHPLRRLKKTNEKKRTTNPLYNTM